MHGSEYAQCFQCFRSNAVIFRLFRVCNTFNMHTGQTFTINWSKIQLECWCYLFHVQISDCFTMWLRFVCKQSDENQSVHKCPFFVVIFWALFQCVMTVSWNQPQPGCWNYLYYIYSFIHANTQHNISNKNSFQQCFIFNWSAQLWSA